MMSLSVLAAVCCFAVPAAASTVGPHALRADGTNIYDTGLPQYALGAAHPTFEWASPAAEHRGSTQLWYQISLSEVTAAFTWTSGRRHSEAAKHVYDGAPLVSGTLYEWRVTTFSSAPGAAPEISAPARFRVSLLGKDPWAGVQWLGSDTLNVYRATFELGDLPAEAIFYVCGLGYSSVAVNGMAFPGLKLVTAPWTNNEQLNGFSALDIKSLLRPNMNNTITVELGQGWRNTSIFVHKDKDIGADTIQRVLRAQLRTSPADKFLSTGDATWTAAAGPVVEDSVYDGETFDASKADLDALSWIPAPVLADASAPQGKMIPWSSPPVQISRVIKPVGMTNPKPNIYVVDFGANLAGVVELRDVDNCQIGERVTLRHAEIMQHAGLPGLPNPDPTMIYQANLRSARATDTYLCAKTGSAAVTWSPKFTYHGFRFVEVDLTNAKGVKFSTDNIVMLHFHSNLPQRTNATFSSPTLTRLQTMALGAQRSNFMTVPTDCDQRDERLGWMGDANLSGDSMFLNYDSATFMKFFLQGIASEQGQDGSMTDVVPFVRFGNRPGDVSWTAAFTNLIHAAWKIDDDTGPAKMYLSGKQMQMQVNNVESQAANGLENMHTPYGDWCPPPKKQGGGQGLKPSSPYTSAFSYLAMAKQVADMANATGDIATAATYGALRNKLNDAFNAAFLNATDGCYDGCSTQTAQVLALALGAGVTSGAAKAKTLARLVENILSEETHFNVGIIGHKFLYDVLKDGGQEKLSLDILEQTDYPSLGYFFANPLEKATENLWELPDAPAEGTGMNSRNHHMWSSYSQYLVRSVAGLGGNAQQLLLRPASVDELASASVSMNTPYGVVAMSWTNVGGVQTHRVAAGNGDDVVLSCGEGKVEHVAFASFGSPRHSKELHRRGEWIMHPKCHAEDSLRVVESLCLNQTSCIIPSDTRAFAALPETCAFDHDHPHKLWIKAMCSTPLSVRVSVSLPLAATAVLELPMWRIGNEAVRVLESGEDLFGGIRGVLEPPKITTDNARRKVVRVKLGSGNYDFEMSR
jgi:alpha-L-rhamnosidase